MNGRLKKNLSLLNLGLCGLCLFAQPTKAEGPSRHLDLSELSESVQKTLLHKLPILEKSDFHKADLEQAIRYLVAQELFDTVEVQEVSSDNFKIFVGKNKRIASLLFTGNKNFSESEVRQEFALFERSAFDQNNLMDAGERVRNLYTQKAFLNAIVDLEFSPQSPTDMAVKVKITENRQTTIKSIDVNCENSDLKKKIEKLLRKHLGDPLTEASFAEIRKAIKEFFGSKRYLKSDLQGPKIDLQAGDTEAHLLFTIDKSDQYQLEYKGNFAFSNSRIDKAIDIENFYSSNPNLGPELASKIKNFYLSEGYARVQVTPEEGGSDTIFRKRLRFDISEGPKVRIKNIDFAGKLSLSSEEYKKILIANSPELIQDGYYNRDDLETGFKNLVIERQNQGFLKTKYVSSRASYNKERDQVSILVNFDEGPLTLVQKIQFIGNSSFAESALRQAIGIDSQKPLRLNHLEEAILKLKNFYRNQGYLEMSLLNEREDLVNYNNDNTLADLKFQIAEGPKVTVGSILIEGNSLTRESIILKELDFKINDVLTPQNLEESTRRLQRLGHFTAVEIRTQEERTQLARRTVIVKVADREPGLFNTGIGFSNERQLTLRGFLGIAYRNIAGTGRGASARLDTNYNIADIKYLERKATIGYLEPYLFDSRIKGKINFGQSNLISSLKETNAIETRQVSFSIEQDITSHILASFDIWNKATYWNYSIKDYYDTDLKENLTNGQEISRVEIASIGPTLDIDFRDHPFNPTQGTFTRLNVEYASPELGSSSTIQYVRSLAGFTHYFPLTKTGSWVWANSTRFGYLKNLSGKENGGVPYDKKGLSLGGQSSLRGFTGTEAFPNANDFARMGSSDNPPLLRTEARSYLLKSELRFPIKGNFGGAFFYEGGAVLISGTEFQDPYRDAVGIALRYATPVGAVSLEWGVKLDRNQHPERDEGWQQFHISIGTF